MFPEHVSVITIVILGNRNGVITPLRKFRLANSRHDLAQFAKDSDGKPVLGPAVHRERTKKELVAAGMTRCPYLSTLVSLCNTGAEPIGSSQRAA